MENRLDPRGRDLRLQALDTRLGPVIDHFAEQAAVDVPVGAVTFDGGLQALSAPRYFWWATPVQNGTVALISLLFMGRFLSLMECQAN